MKETEEDIKKNFIAAFNKQIDGIAKTVAKAIKTRENSYVNLNIEVLISEEPLPNSVDLDKLSTSVVITDMTDRKMKLDERSN